jgi:hypothetical protein
MVDTVVAKINATVGISNLFKTKSCEKALHKKETRYKMLKPKI